MRGYVLLNYDTLIIIPLSDIYSWNSLIINIRTEIISWKSKSYFTMIRIFIFNIKCVVILNSCNYTLIFNRVIAPWPAFLAFAIKGASTSNLTTFSEKNSLLTILFILIKFTINQTLKEKSTKFVPIITLSLSLLVQFQKMIKSINTI